MTRFVGMSRTDLHRKLEKTVGMSATEYIRFVRLYKAAELLIKEPARSTSSPKKTWRVRMCHPKRTIY